MHDTSPQLAPFREPEDMEAKSFSIVYDGEPVSEGSIDVNDLAPSLVALGELIESAIPFVDPSIPKLSLRIKPTFKKGSFEVFLEVRSQLSNFVNLFSSNEATAICNLLAIVGISGSGIAYGCLQLIKKVRGRTPEVGESALKGHVRVLIPGEEPIDVDTRVWSLFNFLPARKQVERILRPLDNGFESFEIRQGGSTTLEVADGEVLYFRAPPSETGISTTESRPWMEIVSLSFKPGNKWRLRDGSRTLNVTIEDSPFQERVQAGEEAFAKGDFLQVTLLTKQSFTDGKLQADYIVSQVHLHKQKTKIENMNLFDDIHG